MKQNFPKFFSGAYFVLALLAFIAVFRAPPDGLANLPLVIVSFPMIIIERALTYKLYGSPDGYLWEPLVHFVGLPGGYNLSHLYWFVPLIAIQTYLIYLIGSWIRNKLRQ